MILITGATGTIGSEVLHRLTARGEPVRALARTPAKVKADVEIVQGDFEDPASLARAVAGVEAVFLVTAPSRPVADHDLALTEAARSAGVDRIVKLSAIKAGELINGVEVGAWHRLTEKVVETSGVDWTILRPSSFASNLLQFADLIRTDSPVPSWTGTGRMGVIAPRDVAAVAVEALTTRDHIGQRYTLTGSTALTFDEQVGMLADVLGKPIRTFDMSFNAVREMMTGNGLDPAAVEMSLVGIRFSRAGHYAEVNGEVARLLGREPIAFAAWARENQGLFR
jgi:uncharacterized protein YbjT (DUF2867 family)